MKKRFLPKYVSSFFDRHRKERFVFRRKGYPSGYFKGAPGTEQFRSEYASFMSPDAISDAAIAVQRARIINRSLADLLSRYIAEPIRLGPTEVTQTKVRQILERFTIGREDRLIRDITFEHVDAILSRTRRKSVDAKGKTVGGVEAAKKLRKELRRLFQFAVKLKWIAVNPVDEAETVKVAPSERSTGFYAWTENDIAKFRNHWKLGTKQRLAMELLLWTDQRKTDTVHLGPQHVCDGKFVIRQTKTGKTLILPIAPQLLAALQSMTENDGSCFLVTEWGKPFSAKGFGNWFRKQCDAAGLPKCTAHGLRKATMRRMAEQQMTNASMKAVSGHSKDEEVARYIESANQERLAESAITQISAWEMSNLEPRLDSGSQQGAENK